MALEDKPNHQLEQLTGLLSVTNDDSTSILQSTSLTKTTPVTTPVTTTITTTIKVDDKHHQQTKLHSNTLAALTALRDSNPALLRKIRLAHSSSSSNNNDNNNNNNNTDDFQEDTVAYWNCFEPPMITIDETTGGITQLNLGGSMLRIRTVEPFLTHLTERPTTANNNNENENDVTKNNVTEPNTTTETTVTTVVPSLRVLNLGGTDVPTSSVSLSLHQSPSVASSIKELYLGGNGIAYHPHGIRSLTDTLSLCTELTILDLRYNDLTGNHDDWGSLATAIAGSNIEVVHLEGNNLGCDGVSTLGEALRQRSVSANGRSRWIELYLGANNIGPRGAEALAACWKYDHNRVGGGGGGGIGSSLKKLYLDGNHIGDTGADAFSSVLEDAAKRMNRDGVVDGIVLESLFVDNNAIGEQSRRRLGRALNLRRLMGGMDGDDGGIGGDGSMGMPPSQ